MQILTLPMRVLFITLEMLVVHNGKPFNFPIVEKLFIDLEAITNYNVGEVKINVSNVTEDFNRFKRNYYALKNKPRILKDDTGKDSLTDR